MAGFPGSHRQRHQEKVEHARYLGRMHWLGFNTQRITSVRAGLQ